jgi:hypothetical protein
MDSFTAKDFLRRRRQSDYTFDDDYFFASEPMGQTALLALTTS